MATSALHKRTGGIFAYSNWDSMPVLAALLHAAFLVGMFVVFPVWPWWANGILGCVYAMSISWNINGVAHNFIHNPYFRWTPLNRAFSILESLLCGFSQTFYDAVHRRHHMGNSDLQDEHGDTVDWLSIYRHGHDGKPENPVSYIFLSYFRDNIGDVYAEVKKRSGINARWGIAEIAIVLSVVVGGFFLNWKFMLFLLAFNYLGQCASSLNGYYRHFGGDPEKPVAWGVSTYGFWYNLIWFNNGYHAEHHYRPRVHWTAMKRLHAEIAEEQRRAGTHVIKMPHPLGFLEPKPGQGNRAFSEKPLPVAVPVAVSAPVGRSGVDEPPMVKTRPHAVAEGSHAD